MQMNISVQATPIKQNSANIYSIQIDFIPHELKQARKHLDLTIWPKLCKSVTPQKSTQHLVNKLSDEWNDPHANQGSPQLGFHTFWRYLLLFGAIFVIWRYFLLFGIIFH